MKTAQEGPIEEGTIYIGAPNYHILLERDGIRLVQGPKKIRIVRP
jgi:hypothetical protein